eukprot:2800688-Pleurochrysis_carterae.AAC.9
MGDPAKMLCVCVRKPAVRAWARQPEPLLAEGTRVEWDAHAPQSRLERLTRAAGRADEVEAPESAQCLRSHCTAGAVVHAEPAAREDGVHRPSELEREKLEAILPNGFYLAAFRHQSAPCSSTQLASARRRRERKHTRLGACRILEVAG